MIPLLGRKIKIQHDKNYIFICKGLRGKGEYQISVMVNSCSAMHASIVSFHRLTTCTVRMRNDDVVSTLPYSLPPLATKLSSCSTLCCCVKLPPFTNPTLTTFVLTPFSFYIFLLFISPPNFQLLPFTLSYIVLFLGVRERGEQTYHSVIVECCESHMD